MQKKGGNREHYSITNRPSKGEDAKVYQGRAPSTMAHWKSRRRKKGKEENRGIHACKWEGRKRKGNCSDCKVKCERG